MERRHHYLTLFLTIILSAAATVFSSAVYSQATCAAAVTLTPGSTCTTTTGNMQNAVSAVPAGACGGATVSTTYGVWYKFTASSTNTTITVNNLGSNLGTGTTYIELLNGTCGTFTSLACQTVANPLSATLTVGTQYYVRVYVTSNPTGNPANKWAFDICVQNPPANDNCSGAVSLSTAANCTTVSSTISLATASTGLPVGCEVAGTHYDTWYSFVAGSSFEIITISSLGSNFTNPALQLYSGTCGSLTSRQCGTTSITATGLTVGTTYYLRVSNVGTAVTSNGDFNICISHPTGASYDYGKSYVNITRATGGGTINPGDTLEVRATLVIRAQSLDSLAFFDTLRAGGGLRYVPGTMVLRTNEGKAYKTFTDALDSDAGYWYLSGSDSVFRFNIGTNSSNVARGRLTNNSKPSVFGSTCIIMATYRVVVYSGYGSTVNLGGGYFTIRDGVTGVSSTLNFKPRSAIVYSSPGLCPGPVAATNAIGGDFNGTFGTPSGPAPLARNRGTSTNVLGYLYKIFATGGGPNDYYYGIANNTSATYTTINTWPKPDSRRVFSVWDIIGDHTGATNTSKGNNPCDTTQPVSATNPCGYMLVINSAYKTDTAFQFSVTNLCPNTYYEISAWIRNICYKCGCDSNGTGASGAGYIPFAAGDSSGVQPNVAFDINGTDYYSSGNIAYSGVTSTQQGSDSVNRWVKRGFTYITGASQTSLTLTIRNNAPGGGGNDWALDDISLATCLPNMNYSPSLSPTVCDSNNITIYDTVRSYFNNYNYYKWQRSTDGGATWTDVSAVSGPITPTWNGSAWEYITSYTVPPTATTVANNGDRYRLIVGTTSPNMSNTNCQVTDGVSLITLNVVDCNIPLRTDILSFNGSLVNDHGKLLWTTSKEDEPVKFEIEKSFDGLNFSAIGMVAGNQDPLSERNDYSFTDPTVVSGKAWYRIIMTNSSNRKYTRTILLSNGKTDFTIASIVNPFASELVFNVDLSADSKIDVNLLDLFGKRIKSKSYIAYTGTNSLILDNTDNLAPGTYILQITSKQKTITAKVVKK